MIQVVIILVASLTFVGTVLQAHGWWQRYRVIRTIPTEDIVCIERGVSLRVLVQGITGGAIELGVIWSSLMTDSCSRPDAGPWPI
jgi:hypothetical protein